MDSIERLISRYPKLYHMAESGSWPSIQRHGLLSTTALLDLFEIRGEHRFKAESQWRESSVRIIHPSHGEAVIRDQKPMPPRSLERVLVGVTPQQWYELLNRKTFFWVKRERLLGLLNAQSYRDRAHDVIILDTRALVSELLPQTTLSPINSGAVVFGLGMRGLDTFKNVGEHYSATRPREVVELAIDYKVPDIVNFALSVHRYKGSKRLETIWERQ